MEQLGLKACYARSRERSFKSAEWVMTSETLQHCIRQRENAGSIDNLHLVGNSAGMTRFDAFGNMNR